MGKKFDEELPNMTDDEVMNYDENRLGPRSRPLLEKRRKEIEEKRAQERESQIRTDMHKKTFRLTWTQLLVGAILTALLGVLAQRCVT